MVPLTFTIIYGEVVVRSWSNLPRLILIKYKFVCLQFLYIIDISSINHKYGSLYHITTYHRHRRPRKKAGTVRVVIQVFGVDINTQVGSQAPRGGAISGGFDDFYVSIDDGWWLIMRDYSTKYTGELESSNRSIDWFCWEKLTTGKSLGWLMEKSGWFPLKIFPWKVNTLNVRVTTIEDMSKLLSYTIQKGTVQNR